MTVAAVQRHVDIARTFASPYTLAAFELAADRALESAARIDSGLARCAEIVRARHSV